MPFFDTHRSSTIGVVRPLIIGVPFDLRCWSPVTSTLTVECIRDKLENELVYLHGKRMKIVHTNGIRMKFENKKGAKKLNLSAQPAGPRSNKQWTVDHRRNRSVIVGVINCRRKSENPTVITGWWPAADLLTGCWPANRQLVITYDPAFVISGSLLISQEMGENTPVSLNENGKQAKMNCEVGGLRNGIVCKEWVNKLRERVGEIR